MIPDQIKPGNLCETQSAVYTRLSSAFKGEVNIPEIRKNNETGSRSACMRPRSDPPNFGPIERGEKQSNNID